MRTVGYTDDGRWMITKTKAGGDPGQEYAVVVNERTGNTSPVLLVGSFLAHAEAGDWHEGPGIDGPPEDVLRAAKVALSADFVRVEER